MQVLLGNEKSFGKRAKAAMLSEKGNFYKLKNKVKNFQLLVTLTASPYTQGTISVDIFNTPFPNEISFKNQKNFF